MSSQGDRMLMGNSVEGRFPFLDPAVMALANSLPSRYKLNGLKEKFILKQLGERLLPPEILARPKQPYRAPDAASFVAEDRPEYVDECLSERTANAVGVFDAAAVGGLWRKCRTTQNLTNTDNMALLAVLSTHLVFEQVIEAPLPEPTSSPHTVHIGPGARG